MSEIITQSGTSLHSPLDVHRMLKRKELASPHDMISDRVGIPKGMDQTNDHVDFASWLPFASKIYKTSPRVEDYILVPVIIMPSDLPNRNGVGFPLEELVRFDPEAGCQAYKTWKGKGTYYEHANQILHEAKGIIVDTYMRKFKGFGGGHIWKLVALLAFDRSKDPQLCKRILNGDLNTYSMGAYVTKYKCSVCGRDKGLCSHLSSTKKVNFDLAAGGKLVYQLACGITGFETSAVEDPAYTTAISDVIMPMANKRYP
ncbi:hypothetical protein GR11A_00247 [Vibrio phage vB_VcorM_GR11A]|nr:hypothetical protein GR11A_00247 [Vibrio phage vB_VcorM_GR11A]